MAAVWWSWVLCHARVHQIGIVIKGATHSRKEQSNCDDVVAHLFLKYVSLRLLIKEWLIIVINDFCCLEASHCIFHPYPEVSISS